MFESKAYPQPLEESVFMEWLEKGRSSRIPYAYLLILWDELEQEYSPRYLSTREEIEEIEKYGNSPAPLAMVAAYDLYSETRVG